MGGWGGEGVAWVEVVGVGGAVVMVMKREREIVYYYRWDSHEHILCGDDRASCNVPPTNELLTY